MPPTSPLLVFDGDCGICTRLAAFTRRRVAPGVRVEPWQGLDLAALGLTEQQCQEALQWVDRTGIRSAQDAVAAVLLAGHPWWWPAGAVLRVPGVHALAGVTYRWVARHRHQLPGGTPACALPPRAAPPPHTAARSESPRQAGP